MEENTAKSQLERIEAALEAYERGIGLPKIAINEMQISEYMNMSREVMESLHPSQCYEIASQLVSAAYHFQKCKNREDTITIWVDGLITKIVTGRLGQYSVGSFNQNFNAAMLDDGFTVKLFDMKQWAMQRSKRIEYLPNSLRDKADSFKELGRNKEKKYG